MNGTMFGIVYIGIRIIVVMGFARIVKMLPIRIEYMARVQFPIGALSLPRLYLVAATQTASATYSNCCYFK